MSKPPIPPQSHNELKTFAVVTTKSTVASKSRETRLSSAALNRRHLKMSLGLGGPPAAASAGAAVVTLTLTQDRKKIPTVTAGYDIEKHNGSRSNANITQSKFLRSGSDMDVPAQQAAGSTLPLVLSRGKGGSEEDPNYNPFEHRNRPHPTTDLETLIHLLKGSLGSGILAMPMAFKNAGLWCGLVATIVVGFICTYCVHILVKCAHILCHRRKIPMMGFADVAEQAFLDGPPGLNRWSRFIRFIVNLFLVVDLLGCCCIYLVFVATNLKQVVDFYGYGGIHLRVWIVIVTSPLLIMCLVRNLKFLTPFSMIANVMIFVGLIITCTYIFADTPSVTEREPIAHIVQFPLFFGTVIFALEGIGVVMSLENDMKKPQHFIGCPSVLNIGMGTVLTLYTFVGFFGYLKYGDDTAASITLNLPVEDAWAQSVKLMIALAIFFTFTLQFYVPLNIIWKGIKDKIPAERQNISEYALRVSLVVLCCAIAVALPNLGPFISLIGAVCLSTLGLIIPSIIELAVYFEYPGYGRFNWRLWKNIFLISFGALGFSTGTYVSILEFLTTDFNDGL